MRFISWRWFSRAAGLMGRFSAVYIIDALVLARQRRHVRKDGFLPSVSLMRLCRDGAARVHAGFPEKEIGVHIVKQM